MAFDYSNCRNTVNFSDIITFTRATEKTAFDRFGNLTTFASGVPAVPVYDPATGQPLGLSVHEQRTNLLTYSEQFDNAAWIKNNAGTGSAPLITANAGVAPDGTITADRIQFDLNGGTTSSDRSELFQSATVSTGTETAKSIWLKSNTGLSYDIAFYDGGSGTNRKITVTPEWQRFSFVSTAVVASAQLSFGLRNISGIAGQSDVADILAWGAQLEAGSFPTPYIKTEATTATRNADVPVINNINTLPWWNPNEGKFILKWNEDSPVSVTGLQGVFSLRQDDIATNQFSLYRSSLSNLNIQIRSGGTTVVQSVITNYNKGGYNELEMTLTPTGVKFVMNGSAEQEFAASIPTSSYNKLELFGGGTLPRGNGTFKEILYYPNAGA